MRPLTAVAVVALAALVAVGVYYVRAATIGRDTPPSAGSSLEVIVEADTVREPESATLEMARAFINTCRLQVNSSVVEERFRRLGDDTFRFVLQPNLIERDQRQLRGCLEDARIQHLQLDVVTMREFEPQVLERGDTAND